MSVQTGLLILGNQLFPLEHVEETAGLPLFMAEDRELCTYVRHHQQKLVLFLAAMRSFAERAAQGGHQVTYWRLEQRGGESYECRLAEFVENNRLEALAHFEIEDHFFEQRIQKFCQDHGLRQIVLPSPMFISSRQEFSDYLGRVKRPFMADFYKRQRRKTMALMNPDGTPEGGRWSFDQENRRKLPRNVEPPAPPRAEWNGHVDDVVALVQREFSDHPGDAADFWWPVDRGQALQWVQRFLDLSLENYGSYQDAISQRSDTLYHSILSPLLNLGLITPRDLLEQVLAWSERHQVPLNSLEGFVRQLIGWREFIRGIYHEYDHQQQTSNFWQHRRRLGPSWYTGDTGIPPLDDAIKAAMKLGWTHHILRLMVIGNLMTLSEIEPGQAHRWFMETHVDSSDWVMGPNVYGMALFSDGGIFATKPYICGSNYLLKMSDYPRGDWCDTVDGLYWRFIDRHREFFAGNPRLSMMVRTLDRINPDRRATIDRAARLFLKEHTLTT